MDAYWYPGCHSGWYSCVLVPWVSLRGGKASYWYPGCQSGAVELRTGTLGVIQGGRADTGTLGVIQGGRADTGTLSVIQGW